MVFWNSLEIRQPPTNVCKVSTGVFRKNDLLNLKSTVSSASLTLNELSQLHTEAALLSRTLYKNKISFRNHKGFKKLEKINRGLLRYLAFNLNAVYSTFAKMLPDHPDEFEFVLPTKQMLEWVLVSTQGFAKLFCVLADSCEETACFWKTNIQRGDLFNVSVLFLGIVSRIWSYSQCLVQSACKWFTELRPYLSVLQYSGIAWLPQSYNIPNDLAMWLNSRHTKSVPLQVNMQKRSDRLFDFIDIKDNISSNNDKDEFPIHVDDTKKYSMPTCQHYLTTPLPSVSLPQFSIVDSVKPVSFVDKEDFGEVVPKSELLTKKKVLPVVNFGTNAHLNLPTSSKVIKKKVKSKKHRHPSFEVFNKAELSLNSDFITEVQGNSHIGIINECKPTITANKKKQKVKESEKVISKLKIGKSLKALKNKEKKKLLKLQMKNTLTMEGVINSHNAEGTKNKQKPQTNSYSGLYNALTANTANSHSITSSTKPLKKQKKKKKRKNKELKRVN